MQPIIRPPKKEILRLMAGFRRFKERFFSADSTLYNKLSSIGQRPKTLVISCSDSRVDPAILFNLSPGEVFVVRNVANLVPPCENHTSFHGVSAAIEFAVVNLQVESIIILGHRQCGGIRSLFQPQNVREGGFVQQWMSIAKEAKERSIKLVGDDDFEKLCRTCEQESIQTSIQNLKSFPFVAEAINSNKLQIFGVYFDIEEGQLWSIDEATNSFQLLLK
ncbi:MAG: carbonic anhydrase [Bdellovibrionia bacterium]